MRTSGNNAKLSSDICDRILGVASKSVSLQEIHVPSIGARWEFAARLSQVKTHAILIACDTDRNYKRDRLRHYLNLISIPNFSGHVIQRTLYCHIA